MAVHGSHDYRVCGVCVCVCVLVYVWVQVMQLPEEERIDATYNYLLEKMTAMGQDPALLEMDPDDYAPDYAPVTEIILMKDDPKYAEYVQMIVDGTPMGMVSMKMDDAGIEPMLSEFDQMNLGYEDYDPDRQLMELGPEDVSPTSYTPPSGPPLKDDPRYAKYFRMIGKIGKENETQGEEEEEEEEEEDWHVETEEERRAREAEEERLAEEARLAEIRARQNIVAVQHFGVLGSGRARNGDMNKRAEVPDMVEAVIVDCVQPHTRRLEKEEDRKPNELKIHLIGARNLMVMDQAFFGGGEGSSDPFVTFQVTGGVDQPSTTEQSTVKKKDLNPSWDETFFFDASDDGAVLEVQVFDKDLVGSSDFMGRITIPLASLLDKQEHRSWHKLLNEDGEDDSPTGQDADAEAAAAAVAEPPKGENRSLDDDEGSVGSVDSQGSASKKAKNQARGEIEIAVTWEFNQQLAEQAGLYDKRVSEEGTEAQAVYRFLGIIKDDNFPMDVVDALRQEGDVKYRRYFNKFSPDGDARHVIHALGLDLRDMDPTFGRDKTLVTLTKTYVDILTEFIGTDCPMLRLTPLASSAFVGPWRKDLPELTVAALNAAFGELSSEIRVLLFKRKLELCIFEDADYQPYFMEDPPYFEKTDEEMTLSMSLEAEESEVILHTTQPAPFRTLSLPPSNVPLAVSPVPSLLL